MDNCPGTDLTTLYHEICTIPIATLRTDPYNLDWATNVHVKIQAITLKGSSPFSEIGSGAEILDTPDAPQSFLNNLSQQTRTSIGLTWYEGAEDGGRPVLDYRL